MSLLFVKIDLQKMLPVVREYDDPLLCADYVSDRPRYPKHIINSIVDYIKEGVG